MAVEIPGLKFKPEPTLALATDGVEYLRAVDGTGRSVKVDAELFASATALSSVTDEVFDIDARATVLEAGLEGLDDRATTLEGDIGTLGGRIGLVEANQVSGRLTYETWSALSAVTGSTGQGAEVPYTDSGSHTDPVVGGTAPNSGLYIWSASPAGWKWVTADAFSAKADKSEFDNAIDVDGFSEADTDGMVAVDDFGWVLIRVSKAGGVKTALLDLGHAQDDHEFAIVDQNGFVQWRVDDRGAHMGNLTVGTAPNGDMVVTDEAGFVALRVNQSGKVSQAGMAFDAGSDGEIIVHDDLGFVGFRLDHSGLAVNGLPAGGSSATDTAAIAAALPDIEYLARGTYLPAPPILPKLRKALAGVVQSIAPARIAFVGDSNTMGLMSESPSSHLRVHSAPDVVARVLAPLYGAKAASVWGNAGLASPSAYNTYDPRVTPGAGWGWSATASLGGMMWSNDSDTSSLSFAPGVTWDTAEVYVALSTAATLSLDVGGTVTEFTPATGSVQKVSYTPARGVNSLNIKRVSGAVNVIGVVVRDSTAPEINVFGMGRSGWQASHWADIANFWSPRNALAAIGADLFLIELGLNEFYNDVDPVTFGSNLQTVITACKAVGDVIVVSSVTPRGSHTYEWSEYVSRMRDLAQANGISMLDMTARFGGGAGTSSGGFVSDNLHPNAYGYGDKGRAIANILARL